MINLRGISRRVLIPVAAVVLACITTAFLKWHSTPVSQKHPAPRDALEKPRPGGVTQKAIDPAYHGPHTVSDVPYAPTSSALLRPFPDPAHQRRLNLEFLDDETELTAKVRTHLCLPGLDPCVSGGTVALSDGSSEWSISFQLLGSSNPGRFQSQLPTSRAFLQRLKSLVAGTPRPDQNHYSAALHAALDSEGDVPEQRRQIRLLVRLLLKSFITSEKFAEVERIAETQGVLD